MKAKKISWYRFLRTLSDGDEFFSRNGLRGVIRSITENKTSINFIIQPSIGRNSASWANKKDDFFKSESEEEIKLISCGDQGTVDVFIHKKNK